MKRMTRHAVAALAAGALIVTGCADTDGMSPGSESDPAANDEPDTDEETVDEPEPAAEPDETEDPEPSVDPEESEEAEPETDDLDLDDAEDDGWQYLEEFDDPIVAEESGVRLSVTGLGINDVTTGDIDADVQEFLEDGTQTLIVLEMTASNDSGGTIDFYPDQGVIQLGREQVEADLWFTEPFAGFDWRDGVDDSGQVLWQLEAPYDEVLAAGELTLVVGGAVDSETFDSVTSDMELVVTWDAA